MIKFISKYDKYISNYFKIGWTKCKTK